jgi:hypothetical protein
MDSTILASVTFVASMFIVGYLAYERRRSRSRWVWIPAAIGPLAIPLLYLIAATSAFRKMINAPRL